MARSEARILVHLPEAGTPSTDQLTGRDETMDEASLGRLLDRLEARGLIERLVDGQLVRTETGQIPCGQ